MLKSKPVKRIFLFAAVGLVLCLTALWILFRDNGSMPAPVGPGFVYQGRTVEDWVSQIWFPNKADNPAIQKVLEIGAPAVPYMVQRLQNRSSPLTRNPLYEKAWHKVPRVIQSRLKAPARYSLEEEFEITAIVCTLGEMGPNATEAVPVLAKMAGDKHLGFFLRLFTVQTLGQIGPGAQPAIPVLSDCLRDQRKQWRREFADECESDIASKDWLFRASAAKALARTGGQNFWAENRLEALLAATNSLTKANAAVALWRMRGSATHSNLVVAFLHGPDLELGEKTVVCLGAVGAPAHGFLPRIKLLASETNKIHHAAVFAVDRIERRQPDSSGKVWGLETGQTNAGNRIGGKG